MTTKTKTDKTTNEAPVQGKVLGDEPKAKEVTLKFKLDEFGELILPSPCWEVYLALATKEVRERKNAKGQSMQGNLYVNAGLPYVDEDGELMIKRFGGWKFGVWLDENEQKVSTSGPNSRRMSMEDVKIEGLDSLDKNYPTGWCAIAHKLPDMAYDLLKAGQHINDLEFDENGLAATSGIAIQNMIMSESTNGEPYQIWYHGTPHTRAKKKNRPVSVTVKPAE